MRPPPLLQLFRGFLPSPLGRARRARSSPRFSPFGSDPFLPFLSVLRRLVLSSFCRYTLRRISTYTTPRLCPPSSSVLLLLIILLHLYIPVCLLFPLPIPILPFLISSSLPRVVLPSLRPPLSRDCFFVSFLRVFSRDYPQPIRCSR